MPPRPQPKKKNISRHACCSTSLSAPLAPWSPSRPPRSPPPPALSRSPSLLPRSTAGAVPPSSPLPPPSVRVRPSSPLPFPRVSFLPLRWRNPHTSRVIYRSRRRQGGRERVRLGTTARAHQPRAVRTLHLATLQGTDAAAVNPP